MNKLSVAVAIYNIESFLPRCLESLKKAMINGMEIILVDDGSTDSCGDLCDRFASENQNVKVIHKKNGGLASARKAGAKAASGEYIAFLDGDDWVKEDYYSSIMQQLEKNQIDVLVTGMTTVIEGNEKKITHEIESGLYKDEDLSVIRWACMFDENFQTKIKPAIFIKVCRLALFCSIADYIDNDINDNEDCLFSSAILIKARSVLLVSDVVGYCYRENPSSMSRKYSSDYWKDMEHYCQCLEKIWMQLSASPDQQLVSCNYAYMIFRYLKREFFADNANSKRERIQIVEKAIDATTYLGEGLQKLHIKEMKICREWKVLLHLLKKKKVQWVYDILNLVRICTKRG